MKYNLTNPNCANYTENYDKYVTTIAVKCIDKFPIVGYNPIVAGNG